MGFDLAAKGMEIRENTKTPPGKALVVCPRCAANNPYGSTRCRSCYQQLSSKAPPKARAVAPPLDPRRTEVDSLLGELEALARVEPAPTMQFQCTRCGRLVDETAARCACGAIFEEPRDIIGYECPLCGTRVEETATRCRCGARFSS